MVTPTELEQVGDISDLVLSHLPENPVSASVALSDCLTAYPIPDAALDDRLGWIGTSGSGKTYNAGGGVDQGTAQDSNPDPYIDIPTDVTVTHSGTMQYTLDMSGLSSGTQYTVVVQARVSSGTLPTNAVNLAFTGTVTLSAP